MSFHVVANLDQEAQWLGAPPLSGRAQRTISAYASLLAALAPSADVTIWTPAAVDTERLVLARDGNWQPPTMRVGTPPQIDLMWANPEAKAVNDRRFAQRLTRELGAALPGACVIHSIDELESHIASGGASASPNHAWVCKALWSSAGRERAHGVGSSLKPDVRAQVERLLRYSEGHVVFEPWLPRIFDVGMCGMIHHRPYSAAVDASAAQSEAGQAAADRITLEQPHGLMSSPRGGFAGIDLTSTQLDAAERDALVRCAARVGEELVRAGYHGPFGIDAFVYRDGDARRLHPLCEINARYTFGHVARALAQRLGISALHFSTSPAAGARMFIRPSRGDAACAWATYG